MHLSPTEEYGIRCCLQLARLEPGSHLSASEIAKREGLTSPYVGKLMFLLRKAKLVEGVRGIQGGFRLCRAPEKINLSEVMRSLSAPQPFGKSREEFCGQFSGNEEKCVHMNNCSLRPIWEVLTGYFDRVLGQVTLKDLIGDEKTSHDICEKVASSQAEALKTQIEFRKESLKAQ
jgi:Rrf2 family protein